MKDSFKKDSFSLDGKELAGKKQLNDGNSLFWTKSWKLPLIVQYDAQPQRIKRLVVLLFLKVP